MPHVKNVPALEFWTILRSHAPSDSHYRWQPADALGGPEAPSTNVWEPSKLPPTMPSVPHVGGWGNVKPAKTRTRAAFLAAEGGAFDFGGRLWRDCRADTLSLQLAHRYRESFCLACAAGVRIKKQLKTRVLELSLHRRDPRSVLGKEPLTAEAWPPNGFPKGGWMGGEGGEFVQNSSSGAFLPSGIYLNRRGSKMAMPLGSIFIPPLLARTLPRLSATTPLANRPWPLARQKHAPRSNSGAFSGREGSAGFQPGYRLWGFMLAGHVFPSGWTPLMTHFLTKGCACFRFEPDLLLKGTHF